MKTAPIFRSLEHFTGDVAESPINKMLDTADQIAGQAAEVERLREENAALRARVDELEAELSWHVGTESSGAALAAEDGPGAPVPPGGRPANPSQ